MLPPLKLKCLLFFLFCAETGASVLHIHQLLCFSPWLFFFYVSHEYRVLTCYSLFEKMRLVQEAEALALLLDCVLLFFPLFPVEAAQPPPPPICPSTFQSPPPFFFCSNKRVFILWGQSGSPLVHEVLRYRRDSPLLLLEFTGGIFISFTCTDGILEGGRI